MERNKQHMLILLDLRCRIEKMGPSACQSQEPFVHQRHPEALARSPNVNLTVPSWIFEGRFFDRADFRTAGLRFTAFFGFFFAISP